MSDFDHGGLLRLPTDARHDLGGRCCWWCGGSADSREHKFKRSGLVRAFGSGAWPLTATGGVAHGVDGKITLVQSSRARQLKFPPVLCRNCDNNRSQSADRAYDSFADYIITNQREIIQARGFLWSAIFDDWRQGRADTTRYWVKHIGTRLAADGVRIAHGLVDFLDGASTFTDLALRLEIRADIWAMVCNSELTLGERLDSFWMGDMLCSYSKRRAMITHATSHWGLSWLRLNYDYDLEQPAASTNFWVERVYLPIEANVDPASITASSEAYPPGPLDATDEVAP